MYFISTFWKEYPQNSNNSPFPFRVTAELNLYTISLFLKLGYLYHFSRLKISPCSIGDFSLFWSDCREGVVFSMTYLWGKPWLPTRRGGRTAEGARIPRR